MPSYTLRQHDNGIFYVHWTEGRRSKRESTSQTEETAAQIYLGEWLKGQADDSTDGGARFLISELWNAYFEQHVEKNNADVRTAETVWGNLSVHFGALLPNGIEIKNSDGLDRVDQYIALRKAGTIGRCPAAPATIRHELSILKAMLAWCAKPKQKILRPADVPVFDLPPDSEPRDRWLRTDEIQKLLSAAATIRVDERLSRLERFLWLALETAARLMAIIELTWDRVDLELGIIHYNVPGRKRTKKRRASVPISKALRPILLRAYKEREDEFVCGGLPQVIWRSVNALAKRAGVADVSPHVLRHTAATHMLRRGVPIWQVAGVLGCTVQMVEKIYGHHVPDGLAAAVESISGGLLEAAE